MVLGRATVVAIVGPVAAGKSSAIEAVAASRPDWAVIPEPTDLWAPLLREIERGNVAANIMLQGMVAAHYGALAKVIAATDKPVVVVERCPADMDVFAALVAPENPDVIAALAAAKEATAAMRVDKYVRIDVDPAELAARANSRNGAGDARWGAADAHREYADLFEAMWPYDDITTVVDGGANGPDAVAAAVIEVAAGPAPVAALFM